MKRLFFFVGLISITLTASFGQNKKADKEVADKVKFEKALAAIESKDFVIIVDTYFSNKTGQILSAYDNTNFFSYEREYAYIQGTAIFGTSYPNTHKLTVSDFKQVTDKKENFRIEMFVRGSMTEGKFEISLKKGSNYADAIYTMKGCVFRFSGEVVPTAESKYFKRAGEV